METGLEGKPWFYGAGVALALTAGVVAGAYYGRFETMKKDIAKQGKSLRGLEDKIREGEAAASQLPQFEEEVERLELELDKLLRILPSRRKTEDLLRRIRGLTEQGDFFMIRFNPRSISDRDDFYSEWSIQLELEGAYHNLARFFDRVSNFARIINIDNLKITSRDTKSEAHRTIKANFLMKTYISHKDDDSEGDV